MFSSERKEPTSRRVCESIDLRDPSVDLGEPLPIHAPLSSEQSLCEPVPRNIRQSGAAIQRHLSQSAADRHHLPDDNPYAPPRLSAEQGTKRGALDFAHDISSLYVSSVIEHAATTATSKYVAGFVLCDAAAVFFFTSVYVQLKATSFSVSEAPHTLMVAGVAGAAALVGGLECGVVLAHRIWKSLRARVKLEG